MIDDIKHIIAFGSLARAEGTYTKDIQANGKRGVVLKADITAETGVATLDVKLQRKDLASGTFTDIPGASIPQLSAIGGAELVVYPGVAVVANVSVSDVVSEDLRVVAVVGGTSVTFTFTIGLALIP